MHIRFGKRKRIRFTERSHPMMGILSVLLGIVALIVLFVLCYISGKEKGNSGIAIGVIGMLSMIMSIVGFFMANKCWRKEDIYMITPTVGSILNGILVIVFLLLFFIGAM